MTNQQVMQNQSSGSTATATRTRTYLAAAAVVLLAAFMALSAVGKLTGGATEMLVDLGVPAWGVPAIGVLELAGAIGLLVPRLRFLAAAGLTLVLVGAVGTHLLSGDFVGWSIPFVLGALTGLVAWRARPAAPARA